MEESTAYDKTQLKETIKIKGTVNPDTARQLNNELMKVAEAASSINKWAAEDLDNRMCLVVYGIHTEETDGVSVAVGGEKINMPRLLTRAMNGNDNLKGVTAAAVLTLMKFDQMPDLPEGMIREAIESWLEKHPKAASGDGEQS